MIIKNLKEYLINKGFNPSINENTLVIRHGESNKERKKALKTAIQNNVLRQYASFQNIKKNPIFKKDVKYLIELLPIENDSIKIKNKPYYGSKLNAIYKVKYFWIKKFPKYLDNLAKKYPECFDRQDRNQRILFNLEQVDFQLDNDLGSFYVSNPAAWVRYWETANTYILSTILKLPEYEYEDDEHNLLYEDYRRIRINKQIERNQTLANKVKKIHKYICQACSFNFEKVYGEIGKNYIEAHHLTPVTALKGKKVLKDPKKDFAVLCSNCHRMIHKTNFVDNIEKFKKIVLKLGK